MEKEYQISWFKVIGALVIFIVIIAGLCLLLPKKSSNAQVIDNEAYINNINLMKAAGFEYFKGSNLPSNVGSSNSISLDEMVENKLLLAFVDENGHTCNMNDSYVKVTKTLDNEYAMKVALDCENKSDYIVTSIVNDVKYVSVSSDKSNSARDVGNTSKVNNTNVNIPSSSNGNYSTNSNNSNSAASAITQITNVNINYVNNCLSSCLNLGLDCNNSCVSNVYYTVNFDSQGGSYVAYQLIKSGDRAKYVESYKEGYKFLGWYYNGEKFDFTTPIYNTTTLVAKWEKIEIEIPSNREYTVSFDTQGAGSILAQKVVEGNRASRPIDPIRDCFEFIGWYYNGVQFDFNQPIRQDITLTARWVSDIKCNNYQVNFDSNGGTYVPSQSVQYGNTVNEPSAPYKDCYRFDGWYTNSSLTLRYDFRTQVKGNMTLYAKWSKDETCNNYQVDFDSNGGTYVPSQSVQYGKTVNEPSAPYKQCYRFDGWYTNSSLTARYNFNNSVRNSMTLYAKWVDDGSCVQSHRVLFDSNGGNYVQAQTVKDGERAYNPGNPTRSGYRFIGWYYNNSEFNFNNRITHDYTLVARWEKQEVRYNTYCKVDTRRYYSTSYVSANHNTWNYSWQIRFDNLRNVENLKITNIGYLTNNNLYYDLYNNYAIDKGISTSTTSSKYDTVLPDVSTFIRTSLKSSNFNKSLSDTYYSGGYWYTNASIYIMNYNNVEAYSSNVGKIHMVPFYFDVKYTDKNNCVDDLASNASRYWGYEVVKTYYR